MTRSQGSASQAVGLGTKLIASPVGPFLSLALVGRAHIADEFPVSSRLQGCLWAGVSPTGVPRSSVQAAVRARGAKSAPRIVRSSPGSPPFLQYLAYSMQCGVVWWQWAVGGTRA